MNYTKALNNPIFKIIEHRTNGKSYVSYDETEDAWKKYGEIKKNLIN